MGELDGDVAQLPDGSDANASSATPLAGSRHHRWGKSDWQNREE
jgi:hypothetical protein